MKPYWEDGTIQLYLGDMREVLPELTPVSPYAETSLAWDRWPDGWPTLAAPITECGWRARCAAARPCAAASARSRNMRIEPKHHIELATVSPPGSSARTTCGRSTTDPGSPATGSAASTKPPPTGTAGTGRASTTTPRLPYVEAIAQRLSRLTLEAS